MGNAMIQVTRDIAIRESELRETFVCASGPGGQNVNKVSTAVQLRFDVRASSALPSEVRERLVRLAGKRMTDEGVLVIDARRFRMREQNRKDAVDRLVELIRKAAKRPVFRRKTRRSPASIARRLEAKRRRSKTKRLRRVMPNDE